MESLKEFLQPETEIVIFPANDVIVTSSEHGEGPGAEPEF